MKTTYLFQFERENEKDAIATKKSLQNKFSHYIENLEYDAYNVVGFTLHTDEYSMKIFVGVLLGYGYGTPNVYINSI